MTKINYITEKQTPEGKHIMLYKPFKQDSVLFKDAKLITTPHG